MLIGAAPETNIISAFWRIFDRAMGLFCMPSRLYLSSKYQLWKLDNVLAAFGQHQGDDRLYIARIAHTTGDIDIVNDFGLSVRPTGTGPDVPERVMANGQCFLCKRKVLVALGGYEVARGSFCSRCEFGSLCGCFGLFGGLFGGGDRDLE